MSVGSHKSEHLLRDPCECQNELGDILRKPKVSFVSLSCIVHTLWDLSSYNLGNSTFTCHLDKNECKLE